MGPTVWFPGRGEALVIQLVPPPDLAASTAAVLEHITTLGDGGR